jgi:hypothetical protein
MIREEKPKAFEKIYTYKKSSYAAIRNLKSVKS